MNAVLSKKRVRGAMGAFLLIGVGVASVSVAQTVEEPRVYTGCLSGGGAISKVAIGTEPAAACTGSSTQISWNETGPQGVQGDTGLQGVQGVPGPQGVQGIPGPITDLVFSGYALNGSFDPSLQPFDLNVGGPGCVGLASLNNRIWGDLPLPVGATVTGMTATWYDASADDVLIEIWKRNPAPDGLTLQGVAGAWSSGNAGLGTSSSPSISETVDPGEQFLVSFIFPTTTGPATDAGMCGIEVHLS